MTRCVLIAGGGSGSLVFPGLTVASELRSRGVESHWLGAQNGLEEGLVARRGISMTLVEIEEIDAMGRLMPLRIISQLPQAVILALKTILRLRPFVVLGVGGAASAAGLLAAGLLGIPSVLQEPNALPSWVNHAFAPWADLVCCGFADTATAFPAAEWTGIPVRESFFEIEDVAPLEKARVLVLEGSEGSFFVNRVVPRALAVLKQRGIEPVVRHQAGKKWSDVVRTSYKDLDLEASVSAIIPEPWKVTGEVDLVIARSGALTVAELAAAGRGALLIPDARSAGNHQEFNARAMERAGAAVVITENQASPLRVAEVLSARADLKIKACNGSNCDWLFIDRTKAGRRQWCDTRTCGNNERVRRFRMKH